MVNYIKYKGNPIKLRILKNRKRDFFRINPYAILKLGRKRLIRKGIINKKQVVPKDNPNHFVNDYFITHWAKTRFEDVDIHIGFTVTVKNVSKHATIRNLVKRRLKNAINETIRDFRIFGYDFIFTARQNILTAKYSDLVFQSKRVFKFIEHRIKETESEQRKQKYLMKKYMD